MFKNTMAFSGFSVDDVANVKDFYAETLGLNVEEFSEAGMPMLTLHLATGGEVMVYPKGEGHQPATYTVLNFPVEDIDAAVDELTARGVEFIKYDTEMFKTDEKGIARATAPEDGPNIAWFTDPAGNIISVLEERE
ncbi:MAG TPA: VOC family protein [Candidatus Saccharimonadales bacterium]